VIEARASLAPHLAKMAAYVRSAGRPDRGREI
jgi:hypothetical protein